jgi:hypothetical protein
LETSMWLRKRGDEKILLRGMWCGEEMTLFFGHNVGEGVMESSPFQD